MTVLMGDDPVVIEGVEIEYAGLMLHRAAPTVDSASILLRVEWIETPVVTEAREDVGNDRTECFACFRCARQFKAVNRHRYGAVIPGHHLLIILSAGDCHQIGRDRIHVLVVNSPVAVTDILVGDYYGYVEVFINTKPSSNVENPDPAKPVSCVLSQNYPNPFNPETEIRFKLAESCDVHLQIFNTLGREIRTLIRSKLSFGEHGIYWDGTDNTGNPVPSGIYLYQLKAGDFIQSKKMSLLR